MQVNPSHQNDPVGQTEFVKRSAIPSRANTDGASFDKSAALNRSLADIPDVRPDRVSRAKQLIADVNYPPQEAIKKISDLLAMKLREAKETDDGR